MCVCVCVCFLSKCIVLKETDKQREDVHEINGDCMFVCIKERKRERQKHSEALLSPGLVNGCTAFYDAE